MSWKIICEILWGLSSFLLIVEDLKNYNVKILNLCIWCFLGLLIAFFENFIHVCPIPILIFSFLGIFYHIFRKQKAFGAADYIAISISTFLLDFYSWIYFLILCGMFGILTGIFSKKEKFIPFLPAIIFSIIIIRIFQ